MIKIMKPGLQTTIQDYGRHDFRHIGVVTSGVMDCVSSRIANWLVGNADHDAVLEMTVIGAAILFEEDTVIAICGADLSPKLNGEPIRNNRRIFVKKGAILKFGTCRPGCRAYLAIAGSFDVPKVMDSKATYTLAKIGGYDGRALRKGDKLHIGQQSQAAQAICLALQKKVPTAAYFWEETWSVDPLSSAKEQPMRIRVMRGKHFTWFDKPSSMAFFSMAFQVSSQSDRMGYRMQGQKLTCAKEEQIWSEAVRFGTIQVPADGDPIILMADSQTTGGYPKIAEVASVDLPLLAQAKPGDSLLFLETSLEEAHQALYKREKQMDIIKYQIQSHGIEG